MAADNSAPADDSEMRHRARVQVCQVIEAAFSGVTLGAGVGLQEGQGIDDYEDAETCAAYRAGDEKHDWRLIPAEALNRCSSSLSFFDAEGMRFHLPAFLMAELREEYCQGTVFHLTYFKYGHGKFQLLNDIQRSAVRVFLLHVADDPEYGFEHDDIVQALEEYWIGNVPS